MVGGDGYATSLSGEAAQRQMALDACEQAGLSMANTALLQTPIQPLSLPGIV